jgi:monoamine oxidase
VGGRIYTLREPFAKGLYGEAGAMRIPRAHKLTMAYLEKFNLQTQDFMMGNPNTYVYIGGVKRRMAEVQKNPDVLGFETSANEKGKLAGDIWEALIKPLVQKVENMTSILCENF